MTQYYPFLSYNLLHQGLAVYFTVLDGQGSLMKQLPETSPSTQEVPVLNSKEQLGFVGISPASVICA
jgi:actin-like ATPase involved in cell morphogenesis